jgi:hypothetical protein
MGMASYQKWTINIKMMKVGKGKAGRWRRARMNFIVNTTPRLLLLLLREREEKSDYRSAREGRGGSVARCVLELIVICVCLTQARRRRRRHHHPKSISSFSLSLSLFFLHLYKLKLYVLPEEAIIHTHFFLFEYVH